MSGSSFFINSLKTTSLVVIASFALTACEGGFEMPKFGKKDKESASADAPKSNGSIKLVERDVEAPEVFQVTEKALWDGRPSLGGVWIAHPDSDQPERVIVRNEENGKFVIGALFRRERDNPGPKLQLSSDAAEALGVLAGSPTTMNVTALRRETVNEGGPAISEETLASEEAENPAAPTDPDDISSTVLASVAEAEGKTAPAAVAAPKPTLPATASKLKQPYLQIGFFSMQDNANATQAKLKTNGIPAHVVPGESKGKKFWRVVAGPAQSKAERNSILSSVKQLGFADAYAVKG